MIKGQPTDRSLKNLKKGLKKFCKCPNPNRQGSKCIRRNGYQKEKICHSVGRGIESTITTHPGHCPAAVLDDNNVK